MVCANRHSVRRCGGGASVVLMQTVPKGFLRFETQLEPLFIRYDGYHVIEAQASAEAARRGFRLVRFHTRNPTGRECHEKSGERRRVFRG